MIDFKNATDLELLMMSAGADHIERHTTISVRTNTEFSDIVHAMGAEIYWRDPARGINGLLIRILDAGKTNG